MAVDPGRTQDEHLRGVHNERNRVPETRAALAESLQSNLADPHHFSNDSKINHRCTQKAQDRPKTLGAFLGALCSSIAYHQWSEPLGDLYGLSFL